MGTILTTFNNAPNVSVTPQDYGVLLIGTFPIDDTYGSTKGKSKTLQQVLTPSQYDDYYGSSDSYWLAEKGVTVNRANLFFGPSFATRYLSESLTNLYIYNAVSTASITAVSDEGLKFITFGTAMTTDATTFASYVTSLVFSGVTTQTADFKYYFTTETSGGNTVLKIYSDSSFATVICTGNVSAAATITLSAFGGSGISGVLVTSSGFTKVITANVSNYMNLSRTAQLAKPMLVDGSVAFSGIGTAIFTNTAVSTTANSDGVVDYGKGTVTIWSAVTTMGYSYKKYKMNYKYYTASAVTSAMIITAIAAAANKIMPKYGFVPSKIHAPGFNTVSTVRTALAAACVVNTIFYSSSIYDIDESLITTEPVDTATIIANKTSNWYLDAAFNRDLNALSATLTDLWLSDYMLIQYGKNRLERSSGAPSQPISNNPITGYTPKYSDEYGLSVSNTLAVAGITTVAKLGTDPWVLWGDNRTSDTTSGVYHQQWQNARDMLFFAVNAVNFAVFRAFLQKKTITPSICRNIVRTVNSFGSSLVANEDQLGFKVTFNEADNPVADLLVGKASFSVNMLTPPALVTAAFKWSTDTSYFSTIFSTK